MASITGFVSRIVHQGDRFYVFSLGLEHSDPFIPEKFATVSGSLCGLKQVSTGVRVRFVGDWVQHPKYGRQFKPYGWFPDATNNYEVERFLSECIEGFAENPIVPEIIAAFGTLAFEKLTSSPGEVIALAGEETSVKRMQFENAVLRWEEACSLSNLSIFLQDYDMSEDTIRSVFARFGTGASTLIAENPYRLVAVEGFPFAKADRLATRVGIGQDDPRRMDGAVLWALRREAQQGHLSVRRGDFTGLVKAMSETEQIARFDDVNLTSRLADAVERLRTAGLVQIDEEVGAYLPELYKYEREAAKKLVQFLTTSNVEVDLPAFLEQYEKGNRIDLSEAQRTAIETLARTRVLVVTGLPGTGKSTITKTVVRLFKQMGLTFSLMAPTGIAAKRLQAVTEESALTIHRTLGYDGKEWGFNHRNKYSVGAIVLDEVSMVDQELFYRVLDALNPSTYIVLVGDDAQLPSVGPGNVLRELLACPDIPHVRLTQIFRQSAQSEIVVAAHKINRGESPQLDKKDNDSEFQFVKLTDEDQIVDLIVQMAAKLKGRDANFQILSPKYDGPTGVNRLNDAVRDKLNPLNGQRQWSAGKLNFREGDRVMVIRNDYKLNIYNGDMGKLVAVEKDHLSLRIHGIGPKAPDTCVDIPKNQVLSTLRLAYTITIHKSQGSEFDTVILPLVRSQGRMLQRNLIYTAITRAKKKVWLIGDPASVHKAVANDNVIRRNTVLAKSVSEEARKVVVPGVEGANHGNIEGTN